METSALEWLALAVVGLLILRELRQLLGHSHSGYYRAEALVVIAVLVMAVMFYRDVGTVRKDTASFAWSVASTLADGRQALESLSLERPEITPFAGSPTYDFSGKVTEVTDGDTITVNTADGKTLNIRFHGIDTPEYNQPHGKAATRAMKRLVSGGSVGIDVKDTDHYGRTVGVVYVDDININEVMVCNGHAWWYKRYAANAANLRRCQESAKTAGKGLWADDNPIPPWEWKRR